MSDKKIDEDKGTLQPDVFTCSRLRTYKFKVWNFHAIFLFCFRQDMEGVVIWD